MRYLRQNQMSWRYCFEKPYCLIHITVGMNQMSIKPEPVAHARFDGLDSLRGLAILAVMIGHFIPQAFPNNEWPIISSFGGAGVLLFFYLSGFLIFRNVQTQSVATFLVRRFFKLMPAYWVSVIVAIFMAYFFKEIPIPDATTIFSNLFMVQDFTRSESLSGVYWTLLIEARFYILIVLFCVLVGSERILWLLAALIIVDLSVYYSIGRGSVLITYLLSFFPGIVATKLFSSGRNNLHEYIAVGMLTSLCLYIFLPTANFQQTIYSLIFTGLLFIVLRYNFKNKILKFLGRISYSHYLFHVSIGYPLIDYMISDGSLSARISALIVASLVTVGIATLFFYLIENPIVNIGHTLSKNPLIANSLLLNS